MSEKKPKNAQQNQAKKAKQDEFYTQRSDIEKELAHYKHHFKDKIVLCNCDDPFESEFFRYFAVNFNHLGLKKLIATSYAGSPIQRTLFNTDFKFGEGTRKPYKAIVTKLYDITGDGVEDMLDIEELFHQDENVLELLNGDNEYGAGDFRSKECVELLKEADIVCTNPPFSLWCEYVSTLFEHKKSFIIIGRIDSASKKDIFPLLLKNEMWFGYGFHRGDSYFKIPDNVVRDYANGVYDPNTCTVHFRNCTWYTNLDIKKRHEELILCKRFDPDTYHKFDFYDAVNVDYIADIPCDYDGVMGVPTTFMDKYNPDQFEILDARNYTNIDRLKRKSTCLVKDADGHITAQNRNTSARILIRNRHPEEPRK